MSVSFAIRVVDKDGSPHEGRKVHVNPTSIWKGWLEDFTDDDGWAHFTYETNDNSIEFHLSVSGNDMGVFSADDGDTLSVTY